MILNGVKICMDPSGALFLPDASILIFSDLHLEKGSAMAARGRPLPPYDTAATLKQLRRVVDHYRPRVVVSLGDSFHDRKAGERLHPQDAAAIRSLTGDNDWYWITGNHDPDPPDWVGGRIVTELAVDGLILRHEPQTGVANGEIAGHLHPKARIRVRGRRIGRRCFASDGMRIVLPAFGAYTGGLDVRDGAFADLFVGPFHAHLLSGNKIHTIASTKLA